MKQQFQITTKNTKISVQKQIQPKIKAEIQIKMPSIIDLSPIWEHTLTEILYHGNKSEMGIIMRSWVKHNNLEDMSDLLIYDLNDFTPGGTLCCYKETAEAEETKLMPNTPLNELYNLYRYIQHLILESEFDYYDDEFDDLLDEGNWLLQTRGNYMKFVIFHSSTATEPRNTSNQKLASFRKGIKREETAYPTLKDERYFDSFSRSLYITANHMSVKRYLILNIHHPILTKNYLRQNKFSCFLYWINIY